DKKLTGIRFQGNRKFRLRSMGFEPEKIHVLNEVKEIEEKQLAEIDKIRSRLKVQTIEQNKVCVHERNFDSKIENNYSELSDTPQWLLPLALEGFGAFPTRC